MMTSPEPSISVMAVDDDLSIRRTVSRYLQKLGCDVRAYDNGKECLHAFEKQPADIVITDWVMPEMDGLTLLQRVKALAPSTEVILMTAAGDTDVVGREGVSVFFEKPFRLSQLREVIGRGNK